MKHWALGPTRLFLVVALLLALDGVWPVVRVASETNARVWALAGIAFLLGALLNVWVRTWLRNPISIGQVKRLRGASLLAFLVVVAIHIAPVGAQLVFHAAIEGFIASLVVVGVLLHLRVRRLSAQHRQAHDPR